MVFTCGMHDLRVTNGFRLSLGRDVQAALEFSRFGEGVAFAVTLSGGVVVPARRECPHAYLHTRTQPKQGPFPLAGGRLIRSLPPAFAGFNGTMDPSDSRPARRPFTVGL